MHDSLETLHIEVPAYPYPISYKGEYHCRSDATKQQLKGAALDRFLLRKQGLHWDAVLDLKKAAKMLLPLISFGS